MWGVFAAGSSEVAISSFTLKSARSCASLSYFSKNLLISSRIFCTPLQCKAFLCSAKMLKVACALWSVVLLFLVAPWTVATILAWVYTEAFEEPPDDLSRPKLGWVSAILQTVSLVVYLLYVPLMVLFIGIAGRRSLLSFCCLVVGVPVFTVAPMVAGGTILYTVLVAEGKGAKEVGVAAAVCCIFSTMTCCFLLCWAIACGGRGRGKHHRYPIPLAYLPFLKDFKEVEREKEVDDHDRYTNDYPKPLADCKPGLSSSTSVGSRAVEWRLSTSSALSSTYSSHTGDRKMSTGSVPPQKRRMSTSSVPLQERRMSASTVPRRKRRRASTSSLPMHMREFKMSTSPAYSVERKLSDNSGKQRRRSTSSMPVQERGRRVSTGSAGSLETTPLPSNRLRRPSLSNFMSIPEHSSARRAGQDGM